MPPFISSMDGPTRLLPCRRAGRIPSATMWRVAKGPATWVAAMSGKLCHRPISTVPPLLATSVSPCMVRHCHRHHRHLGPMSQAQSNQVANITRVNRPLDYQHDAISVRNVACEPGDQLQIRGTIPEYPVRLSAHAPSGPMYHGLIGLGQDKTYLARRTTYVHV